MERKYFYISKQNTLSSPQRYRKIVQAVIAVHLALIFLPLAYFALVDHWKNIRKKDVVVVRLVEVPKEVTSKTVRNSSARRRSVPKTKPTVKTKPVKKQVKKTVPQKTVAEPVPQSKNISKTPPRKTVNTVSKNVPVKPKYTPPSPPDDLEVIRQEDLKHVHEKDESVEDNDEVGATYTEQLVGVFYKLWNPPSSQLLNGRNPKVFIKVKINSYGRVLEAKITKTSGFLPMDRSVAELLKNLSNVPPPPKGEPMEIEFVLIPLK